MSSNRHFKITVVGPGRCGKTSLIDRYASDNYVENRAPAFAWTDAVIETTPKAVHWDGKDYPIILMSRNTSRYVTQTDTEYLSNVFIALYDCSVQYSLQEVRSEMERIELFASEKPVVLVAGKCDLDADVDEQTAQEFAKEYKVPLMSCSAKTGEGVTAVFEWCIQQMLTEHIPEENEQMPTKHTPEESEQPDTKKTTTCTFI